MQIGLTSRSASLALAATLLGMSIQITHGQYSTFAVGILACSLLVGVAGFCFPPADISPRMSRLFLAGLILLQLLAMLLTPDGESPLSVAGANRSIYLTVCLVISITTIFLALGPQRLSIPTFAIVLLAHLSLGVWTIRHVPAPSIDVFYMHTHAASTLAAGNDPYAMTYPDIYGEHSPFYVPNMVRDGQVQYGFLYMPLTLLYSAPASLMLGDPRYAYLLAMLGAAVLFVCIRRDQVSSLLATLFLFTPCGFYILEKCWIEPLSILLFALTIFCAMRRPSWMPFAFGLLLASKQYLPAAIALVPLLDRPDRWRVAIWSTITAAAVTLPMALWDIRAFIHSAIGYHFIAPYRPDALGLLAWWGAGKAGWSGPFWLSFAGMAGALALCLTRLKPSTPSFVAGFSFCFFIFVALSKQAFINYYYLLIATALLGAVIENCTPGRVSADSTLSDHAHPAHRHLPLSDRDSRARAA